MSRCIRKVENEDFYIIYCNTVDMLWPGMWDSVATAQKFLDLQSSNKELFNDVYQEIKRFQGIITEDDLADMIQNIMITVEKTGEEKHD